MACHLKCNRTVLKDSFGIKMIVDVKEQRRNPLKSRKTHRLDLRLSPREKELLKKAAALRHEKVSDYVRVIVLNEAKRLIDQNELMVLSEQDRDLLLNTLDNPPAPNQALKEAMKKFLSHGKS
ncbi:MAG TPA: DUF1778 domain-containing protein [Candidatus Nitrosotenuis sp.]|jgi:uncharacterized protein (DUF1778 family)|nr:DUF1778 domain-containing protein [Candidatus Nitrosotenuis sp.]